MSPSRLSSSLRNLTYDDKLQERNGYESDIKLMNVPFQVVFCLLDFLDQQDLAITNELLRPGNQNIFSKDWNN